MLHIIFYCLCLKSRDLAVKISSTKNLEFINLLFNTIKNLFTFNFSILEISGHVCTYFFFFLLYKQFYLQYFAHMADICMYAHNIPFSKEKEFDHVRRVYKVPKLFLLDKPWILGAFVFSFLSFYLKSPSYQMINQACRYLCCLF